MRLYTLSRVPASSSDYSKVIAAPVTCGYDCQPRNQVRRRMCSGTGMIGQAWRPWLQGQVADGIAATRRRPTSSLASPAPSRASPRPSTSSSRASSPSTPRSARSGTAGVTRSSSFPMRSSRSARSPALTLRTSHFPVPCLCDHAEVGSDRAGRRQADPVMIVPDAPRLPCRACNGPVGDWRIARCRPARHPRAQRGSPSRQSSRVDGLASLPRTTPTRSRSRSRSCPRRAKT